MCGIFCLISKEKSDSGENLLAKFDTFKTVIANRGPNLQGTEFIETPQYKLLLYSSVLWLQGSQITPQPVKNDDCTFVYNGDIFGGLFIDGMAKEKGDTEALFNRLHKSNIMECIDLIEGPFAFILYKKGENKLYFARDKFGRRSLLLGKNSDEIILTSVAKRNTNFTFMELPCLGIFCIDLNSGSWQLFPWKRKNKNFFEKHLEVMQFLKGNVLIDDVDFIENLPFQPPSDTEVKVLDDITKLPTLEIFNTLCKSFYSEKIKMLKCLLMKSIEKRILPQPKFCQNCFNKPCRDAITGVLFSGGVDCAILALLADDFMESHRSIDLINVAFEKNGSFDTPDRITARKTLEELEKLRPQRKWKLLEVNVTRAELNLCRNERISDLIYPLNSVLDDSLGCALWFASRASTPEYTSPCRTLLVGMGADELFGGYTRHRAALQKENWEGLHKVLEEDWQNLPYRNLARDDRVTSDHGRQLRTPYLDEKVVEFVQGLNCWERTFPSKNLPQGVGEKILLRCFAYSLGLENAANLKKRALQFGSRIANSKENGHEICERL